MINSEVERCIKPIGEDLIKRTEDIAKDLERVRRISIYSTIDLLNKIADGEMEEAVFYVNGDFFYDLIVINKNLYVINTRTKQLELLKTKYISKFIRDNVEIIRLDNFEKTLEEEKKIPEKIKIDNEDRIQALSTGNFVYKVNQPTKNIIYKFNEIIDYLDYLESKGDE